jgi:hypothetical protein
MPALSITNPYLRDPKTRQRMIERSARESSIFEGARGLKPVVDVQKIVRKPRSRASTKKSRKAT